MDQRDLRTGSCQACSNHSPAIKMVGGKVLGQSSLAHPNPGTFAGNVSPKIRVSDPGAITLLHRWKYLRYQCSQTAMGQRPRTRSTCRCHDVYFRAFANLTSEGRILCRPSSKRGTG